MGVKGSIYRVSGPLVIAENMRGSKVYEVVEVGNDRLIGEIIGIEGDKAIIQVYEDTTGLRVGEPVYGTGYPLAAELGPGLISSIFDGIQRPLPILQELVGFFIKRGVKVAPLPRDKKWHFIPTAKIGEKVGGGDIIGYVDESETVRHYIMVPPDIHGEIKELAGEGDYTITEPIARIGDKDIAMLQKWPVRKPRPYREKLEPSELLITGQRVIDFFFPLAKGGKAAIPGGFGTGKCVLPGTPVLLDDGRIVAIDELFKEVKNGKPDLSLDEEIIDARDKDLHVFAFNGERFVKARITHVYRGYTNKVVRIKTASGRVIEITPIHKLPVFNPDGYIEFVEAYRITPMDYIVIPRRIPFNPQKTPILPIDKLAEYDDVMSRDENVNNVVRRILRDMSDYEILELSRETGLSKATIKTLAYAERSIPLKLIISLRRRYGEISYPKDLGLKRSRKRIKIPHEMSEKLAEFLGLLISDGSIINRRILFFNNNEILRKRFRELAKSLFNIDAREKKCHTVYCVEIYSSLLSRFLHLLGMPTRRKSHNAIVPGYVFKSPNNIIISFLRGYYLGDGGFSGNTLEFYSASKNLISGLAYILTRLGILYSIVEGGHRLEITGLSELEKFYNIVLRNAPSIDKVEKIRRYITSKMGRNRLKRETIPLSPRLLRKLYMIASKREFEKLGVHIGNQIYGGENITSYGLRKLVNTANSLVLMKRKKINTAILDTLERILSAMKYVALDKVEEISVIEKKTPVYDLTVEEYHNFIGGSIPAIFHNTVTLQQLTKWSAVDIAIYVGCGERGNEMADALHSFRRLVDPRTGKPLVERSVFIANTSNMPVAARETSVFLGATIGEYFRDMGYHVLMVADSTSRWAEAMREISGRLEELPGEEGYPAYLGSRLASFYERSGYVRTLGMPERTGSLTIMGAVSPPGADFSEPVTQSTLRIVRALYALDVNLAYRRHYPAINWLISYSLYVDNVSKWWEEEIDPEWRSLREKALAILQKEAELEELVRLVGAEALPEEDKLVLEVARMIREDFLQQNAFHDVDTYCPPKKAMLMMKAILLFYDLGLKAIRRGILVEDIRKLHSRILIARMKEIPNKGFEPRFEEIFKNIRDEYKKLMGGV